MTKVTEGTERSAENPLTVPLVKPPETDARRKRPYQILGDW